MSHSTPPGSRLFAPQSNIVILTWWAAYYSVLSKVSNPRECHYGRVSHAASLAHRQSKHRLTFKPFQISCKRCPTVEIRKPVFIIYNRFTDVEERSTNRENSLPQRHVLFHLWSDNHQPQSYDLWQTLVVTRDVKKKSRWKLSTRINRNLWEFMGNKVNNNNENMNKKTEWA